MTATTDAERPARRSRATAERAPRTVYAMLFDDGSCYVGQSIDVKKAVRALRQTWKDGPDPRAMVLETVDPPTDAAEIAQLWRRAAKRAGLDNRCWPFVAGYVAISHPMHEDDGEETRIWPGFDGAPRVAISPTDGITRFDYEPGADARTDMQATRTALANGREPARPEPARNGANGAAHVGPTPAPTLLYALASVDLDARKPWIVTVRHARGAMADTLEILRRGLGADNANPRTRFERKARDEGTTLIAFELETVADVEQVTARYRAWLRAAEAAGCVVAGNPPRARGDEAATWPNEGEVAARATVLLDRSRPPDADDAGKTPTPKPPEPPGDERWRVTAETLVRQTALAAATGDWQLMADAVARAGTMALAHRHPDTGPNPRLDEQDTSKALDHMALTQAGRALLEAITERRDPTEQVDAVFANLGKTPVNRPTRVPARERREGSEDAGDGTTEEAPDDEGVRMGHRDPIVVAHAILTYAQAGAWHRQRAMVFTAVEGMARIHAQWQGARLADGGPHAIASDLDGPTADMALQELERHAMGCLLIRALARTRTTDAMTEYVIEHADREGLSKVQPPRRQP